MNHPRDLPAAVAADARGLADWLSHMEGQHDKVIDLGLARVREVQARLGLVPGFPLIVVGGTNGKGSTCALLEAMLRAAGYRVGCYTSPHLLAYNERVRIDARMASDADLCASFAEVEAARGATALTYFEFGTLAAVALFRARAVDVAILEVGLGGRLDAVNAFDADCAVVTSVALDHVDYLGATREAIAFEKAGIFRPGRPAVFGEAQVPASLARHAATIGAPLASAGQHFAHAADGGQWRFRWPGRPDLLLPHPRLVGDYQLANASASLAALHCLRDRLPIGPAAVRAGLLAASVAGRYQQLRTAPEVIVDVAHNPHAAAALARNLAQAPGARRTIAVCAMLADKDMRGVADQLAERVDAWFIAGLDLPRGASAEALAQALRAAGIADSAIAAHVHPAAAYAAALTAADRRDRIVVFGSFHTVAAILEAESGGGSHRAGGGGATKGESNDSRKSRRKR